MVETVILSPFSVLILLGIGIAVLAVEAMLISFYLIWFGLAFIVVAGIHYLFPFGDGLWQLATVSVVGVVLLALLKAKATEKFLASKQEAPKENFLDDSSGEGVIQEGKLYFRGSYWNIKHPKDLSFTNGEKVAVINTKEGVAEIAKVEK